MIEDSPNRMASNVLIIAGMHRSGTSLLANWLARCGLDVGDDLLRLDTDNPAGHYEDVTFLDLHNDILAAHGLDYRVTDHQSLAVSDEHRARAQAIIEARQSRAQWGWKEPRTVLFLDFWQTLLPDVKVLVVYRHYTHVVDSLLRREHKADLRDTQKLTKRYRQLQRSRRLALLRRIPGLLALIGHIEPAIYRTASHLRYSYWNPRRVRRYLKVWQRYNRDLLVFAAAHPDQTLVIHVDDLFACSDQVIGHLNGVWGFDLHAVPVADAYEGSLHTKPMRVQAWMSVLLVPDCARVYSELDALPASSLRRLADPQRTTG